MKPITYQNVTFTSGFWQEVRERNACVSLMNVYRRFQETGRFSALRCVKEEKPPHIFYDSDVAKWLEGAAYLYCDYPDEKVKELVDAVSGLRDEQMDHLIAIARELPKK